MKLSVKHFAPGAIRGAISAFPLLYAVLPAKMETFKSHSGGIFIREKVYSADLGERNILTFIIDLTQSISFRISIVNQHPAPKSYFY
jgi:hypothetical protein